MRYQRLFPLFALALLLGACQGDPLPEEEADAMYDTYGEAFTPEGAVAAQAVAAEPAAYVGQNVTVEGTVREVCQQAGCWLTLDTNEGRTIRVHVARDEDGEYAFTVPKDISGRRVVVHGMLAEAELSEETQHHYAEDGGEHMAGEQAEHMDGDDMAGEQAEHMDGDDDAMMATGADSTMAAPARELSLTAAGVLIQKV